MRGVPTGCANCDSNLEMYWRCIDNREQEGRWLYEETLKNRRLRRRLVEVDLLFLAAGVVLAELVRWIG